MRITRMVFIFLVIAAFFTPVPVLDKPVKKPAAPSLPNYGPLQKQVTDYLAGQPGTYGLYFVDLNSGREFGYNALTPFHAASTFKLPLNLYLYREADRGKMDLNEELVFAKRHLEGGTGILKDDNPGSYYTVAQLAEYSVVHSDNIAANILLERLGRQAVKDFMRSLGARVIDDESNVTCPFDLALYMRKTLDFSRSRAPNSTLLLNHLFNARHKDRIPAPLPYGIRVANKNGTWPPEHTYNDVAYVVHPRRPYILVITSRNTPGYGESLPVIHHLSLMFYDYQDSVDNREENPA